MTLSNARPLAIYAIIGIAILLVAHATNPAQEPFLSGLFMVCVGLWDLNDFQKGQSWMPLRIDRATDPLMFWIGHVTLQTVVVLAVCFPWLYPVFDRLAS